MQEKWKPIKGYEKYYHISNTGKIKSFRFKNPKFLNPWNNGNGYLVVTIKFGSNKKNFYVHRLVAEHFIDNPYNFNIVNHLDFDKQNNFITNLEWCDQNHNVKHSSKNNRMSRGKIKRSDGIIYNSMTEASFKNEVVITSIDSAIRRKHKCKGFYFTKL